MGAAFRLPVDIANRALDHIGGDAINAALGFTEGSRNATIIGRVYDKLRQAELRRNVWRFAIRKAVLRAIDTNTMLLAPSLWSSAVTYFVGSIVSDSNGMLWISRIPNNLGLQPETSDAANWQQYFGPLTVSLYDSATTYSAGELAYTTLGNGTTRVYLSLQSSNADNPATATAWDATVTYFKNQVVTQSAVAYMSRIDFNKNQTPSAATSAADWASATTYNIDNLVTGSDGVTYKSLVGSNLGNNPVADSGVNWQSQGFLTPWTTTFVGGTGSAKWLQIGGAEFPNGVAIRPLNLVYPLGAGPSMQQATKNVYRLPAGYLRMAPQDPKAGSASQLGAPTNRVYEDWNFEGDYIVSAQVGPILFPFVADTADVTAMDPMFCELLAARIGMEVGEILTQSNTKVKVAADFYKQFGTDARLVNAVETGSEEPPLDDWLACRA